MGTCKCRFCNVWMCVGVDFLICGSVYVWVMQSVDVCMCAI